MSLMLTKKEKLQIPVAPVPATVPNSFNISDTKKHDGLEHYLIYHDIFYMFHNEVFPPDDTKSDEYINILKNDIHMIVSHPKLFPYNDVARWFFSYLQK
jgi:hypothetical protein